MSYHAVGFLAKVFQNQTRFDLKKYFYLNLPDVDKITQKIPLVVSSSICTTNEIFLKSISQLFHEKHKYFLGKILKEVL